MHKRSLPHLILALAITGGAMPAYALTRAVFPNYTALTRRQQSIESGGPARTRTWNQTVMSRQL